MLIAGCVLVGGALTVSVAEIVFGDPATPAAATVTVAVYVPEDIPAAFAATLNVPAFVPEAGETVSQPALLLAVHTNVPPPLFDTETLCGAGFDPPAVPENDNAAVETFSAGAGAATVNVTAIDFGDPVAPLAVTVTAPVYVPAPRPLRFDPIVSVPVFVPEAGETVSQV